MRISHEGQELVVDVWRGNRLTDGGVCYYCTSCRCLHLYDGKTWEDVEKVK